MRPTPPSLMIDLYELTMARVYFEKRMHGQAVFSLFIRKYPADRSYFVCAGLEAVLDYLEHFHLTPEACAYLRATGRFEDRFVDYLAQVRFNGEVYALPEGRLFFKDEPVLEIAAPIIEAQLVESAVINAVNFAVIAATKAARITSAAGGRRLVDFSLRRTQGADAGLLVARNSYLAGFDATSNVLAGRRFDIPVAGTMAHSFIMSFADEIDAFRAYADVYGSDTVLLIDTYDTINGARKAVTVAREMAARGQRLRGVRLDSGDMTALSKQVRSLLNGEGLSEVRIFASGGYDEYAIRDCLAAGAPIDAFGVGTRLGVSEDAPSTDMAYKLVAYEGRPVLKLSSGKLSLAGAKQIVRSRRGGRLAGDTLLAREQERPDGEALLRPVMRNGRRMADREPLETLRQRFWDEFQALDDEVKRIEAPTRYPVSVDPAFQRLQEDARRSQHTRQITASPNAGDPTAGDRPQ